MAFGFAFFAALFFATTRFFLRAGAAFFADFRFFVLDFAFIQPTNGRAKVRARVVSSPKHTKRLLIALQKNLERYEERFGRVELGPDEEPMLH